MARKKNIPVSDRVEASSLPNFVVRGRDGTLYLAVAMLEYSEKKAAGDRRKVAGVSRVQAMFHEALKNSPLVAADINPGGEVSMQSEPPGVWTGPIPGPGPIGGKTGRKPGPR